MLGFSSYRDPGLGATLATFDGAGAALVGEGGGGGPPTAELHKAILATLGSVDAPLSPSERGDVATARHLIGVTAAALQARREEMLATATADVAPFAEALQRVAEGGAVAVVTSDAALRAHTGEPFAVVHPLQA